MEVILSYIPHGINENFLYPIRLGSKTHTFSEFKDNQEIKIEKTDEELLEDTKKSLFGNNIPEFVVLYVNRNIRRKRPADVVLAYRAFCDTLPVEDAKKCCLVMHTHAVDMNGTDLPEVVRKLCKHRVVFSEQRTGIQFLNALYNIADVTISLSTNEGFGLGTAESLMAGTPIIVPVTGGLQDQCGFTDENGNYLKHSVHFNEIWTSNHDGKYRNHGDWVIPLFVEVRALMGSPMTPYIFDDFTSFENAAIAIKRWYEMPKEERDRRGLSGRNYLMDNKIGMAASEMSRRFIHDIDYSIQNWKPRVRYELFNATQEKPAYPEGFTLLKDIV